MQVLWKLEKAFVKEVIAELPDPKPHYNTVSTIIRILEDKQFVQHETLGNSHRYFPMINKQAYQATSVGHLLENYFDNSYSKMITYFAQEEKISSEELEAIIDMIKKGKQ